MLVAANILNSFLLFLNLNLFNDYPQSGVPMQTVPVGADPRVRPGNRNVTTHADVYRADAGVRPYRYG